MLAIVVSDCLMKNWCHCRTLAVTGSLQAVTPVPVLRKAHIGVTILVLAQILILIGLEYGNFHQLLLLHMMLLDKSFCHESKLLHTALPPCNIPSWQLPLRCGCIYFRTHCSQDKHHFLTLQLHLRGRPLMLKQQLKEEEPLQLKTSGCL